jgi:hypothetical protein
MDCGRTQRDEGGAEDIDGGMAKVEGTRPDVKKLGNSGERIGRGTEEGQDVGGRRWLVLMRQKLRKDLQEDERERTGREVSGNENGG